MERLIKNRVSSTRSVDLKRKTTLLYPQSSAKYVEHLSIEAIERHPPHRYPSKKYYLDKNQQFVPLYLKMLKWDNF